MFPGFKASGFELCLRLALGCIGWPHFWSMCRALRAVGFGAGAGTTAGGFFPKLKAGPDGVIDRLHLALPSVKSAVFIAVAEIDSHPYDQPCDEPNPSGRNK